MDQFCGSPFWLSNLTWNVTTQPDFSPCFQETVLAWLPCLLLWIFTPLDILIVYRSERRYVPVTLLNSFKIFLTVVLSVLSIAEYLDATLSTDGESPQVNFVTPIVKSATYILVSMLLVFYRNKGVHTSTLLFVFWLLASFASVINFRSLIRSTIYSAPEIAVAEWKISEFVYTSRIISTCIVIVQFILSCIADKKAQDPFFMTGEEYGAPSPEQEASVLSQLTFWWLDPLMWLGYKRALTQDDLYTIKNSNKSNIISQRFDAYLNPQIREALSDKPMQTFEPALLNFKDQNEDSSRPNSEFCDKKHVEPENEEKAKHVGIVGIIIKSFWPTIVLSSLFKLIASLLTFASPLFLDLIITFVSSNEPSWRGYFYALSLFFLSILESIFTNKQEYLTSINVMLVRTCLTSSIYRKTLRISNQGKRHFTTGQVVNFMAVDTQRVSDVVQNFNYIWAAPLQLTIAMVLLYQQLGMAVFAGLAVMLINIPFNGWIAVQMRNLQQLVMRYKDKRIKLLSELFNGIKIVKIHAWEDPFKTRVESMREKEIESLTKQTWYATAITFSFVCMPFAVALASFAFYVLIDSANILDANKVFVSLALFNILRAPLALLPMLITSLSMFVVSVNRINKYLETDEVDPEAVKQIREEGLAVSVNDGNFKWNQNGDTILSNIDIRVPKRKLIAVVGPVGSGKSSLISAMLGNMEKSHGEVFMDLNYSVSYVPQEAWILNSSVKENILLNKVINEERYHRVIEACALGPDLKILDMGDQSDATNLSGGQKQRVCLARAVYADSDLFFMDDPLNAVDAQVGRHIFDHIIGPKGMLRDRTRIFVTNKLSLLPEVDYIFVMKDGKVQESGTYEQLLRNRGVFSELLVKYLLEHTDKPTSASIPDQIRPDLINQELKRIEMNLANKVESLEKNRKLSTEKSKKEGMQVDSFKHSAGPQNQEVTQVGSVGINVHLNFIRTMGVTFMVAQAIYIIASAFTLGTNIWLSEWANDANNQTLRYDTKLRDLRLGVYAGLGLGESICIIISTILLNLACLNSSKVLHNRMLARIMRAPMSWFNITPSGRIINRFSKDIDAVDITIRFNVRLLTIIALRSVTSLILISIGSPYSIIFIIPIVLMYFLFQIFYVSTSRQLKRIESATKSPVYSHFTETITGTSSIRAFRITREFIFESDHRVDINNMSFYTSCVASRWLAIRLEFLGYVVVLITALIAVLSRGVISPGIAGLSVTYSLTITIVMSMLVRTYSDYETNVVCVERLLEYTRTPVEPEDFEEPNDPNWPSRGEITFEDYSTRYRPELELVLRKFNLNVKPSEKVGLVGRTGAGKSSVALALFRVLEAAEGQIIIDDVNIERINLKKLRSNLSIIPQEPILFTGTIRQNIDPIGKSEDSELWRALDLAHLGLFVRSLDGGLDHEVNEGGSNFSVGQKQLFCLARTLCRRSKILVLDEATASVDVETDDLIQKTIRSEFKDSTILTIAHRLETLQDYDRIVVMENGATIEQGSPSILMRNPNSKFRSLAKEIE